LAQRKKPEKLKAEPWYQLRGDDAARKASNTVRRLYDKQHGDRAQWARDCNVLYEGNAAKELGLIAATSWGIDPATFNVVGAMVDTRASHVFKNKVRPYFLTEKGAFEDREKADGMQLAVEGTFHATGIYGELGQHVCWDGEVFEAGAVKVVPDHANGRVLIERIRAQDVYLDKRDAKLGKPSSFHLVTTIDRAVLLDFCRDASEEVRQAIIDAKPAPAEMYDDEETELDDDTETSDRVAVAELWHLPSGAVDRDDQKQWSLKTATHDGRHMIVLWDACEEPHILHDEAWPYDYAPIAFYRPKKKRRGFWSESIPERHVGTQLAVNRMLTRVDGVFDLHARPLLAVSRQANLNTDKITNSWSSILEVTGDARAAIAGLSFPTLPPEYLNHIVQLIQWAYEREGISQLSAAAMKPKGIDSGVALETLQDTESVRHTDVFRAWEDFHVELAKMVVDAFRMLVQAGGNLKAVFGNSKDLKRVVWKDIDLSEDRYHLMTWPTNLLPQTPTGKLQRVIELARAFPNQFPPEVAMKLLDYPDLSSAMGDMRAAEENIIAQIERVTRDGVGDGDEPVVPNSYLALDLAFRLGVDRLNRLEADGMPEERLDRLRQWVEDVNELRKKAAPPPQMAAMPPPVGPTGAPTPGLPSAA
jgi:hypothetical protein